MGTPSPLPPWGSDPVSTFLATSADNARITALRFPDIFALLGRVDEGLNAASAAANNDLDALRFVPHILMARARAGVLAGARLGMSGQVVEAYMPLRGAIEASWYALHMAKDPRPPERVSIWLNRNTDTATRNQCKTEFRVSSVRATHEAVDADVAAIFQQLYDETIEFGAHPNEQGILAAISHDGTAAPPRLNVQILSDNNVLIAAAMQRAIEIGIGVLKTYELIFSDQFRAASLDRETWQLIEATKVLFKRRQP